MNRSNYKDNTNMTDEWSKSPKQLTGKTTQLLVLINGLVLTLATFFMLSSFISGMMNEENKRKIEDSNFRIERDIDNLRSTMRSASTILITSSQYGEDSARRNVIYGVPNIDKFERFFFLRKNDKKSDGTIQDEWVMKDIHRTQETAEIDAALPLSDEELKKYILSIYKNSLDQVYISTDIPAAKTITLSRDPLVRERPYIYVQTVLPKTKFETIVVGIARASKIIDKDWLYKGLDIQRLAIREINQGADIFYFDRDAIQTEDTLLSDNVNSYDFENAGEKWRIITDVNRASSNSFIANAPILILLFGLSLTAIGTLYVRNNHRQSTRMATMNKTLAQKNYELNAEAAERERLNSNLRRTERENKALIDSVSDIIFEISNTGEILFLNGTWKKVTGIDTSQVIGHNLFDLIHPHDQEEQRAFFDQLLRGQKHAYRVFSRLRTADATFRSVELAMSMIRVDENKKLRVVGTLTDVEERRRAERALAEAEKKYRTIVENAAGGIYQITPEGRFLSANPAMARILDFETADSLMRDVTNAHSQIYVNSKERARFVKELETTGFVKNFELEALKLNGEHIWVNENARAVRDDEGHILFFEGSMEDITQRKRTEIKLREAIVHSDLASRAKSEFLSNMGHELRTPLNAIIGFSEIIKDEALGKVENRDYWEYSKNIYESGKQLLTIINEILDVSRIDAGDRQLNESIVNVDRVIKSCIDFVAPKADSGRLIISNLTENSVPNLIAEEIALKQILLNLLSNAIKFTPEGGRITISHEVDHDGVMRLSVTDTGIGLNENEIEKALSPFGQLDSALNRSGSGTGLGLTLVNSLIKLHDGKLEIFSQKGIGTTVTVAFPARRVTEEVGASRNW
jgi:PAS domain S-box-containing protein